MLTLFKVVWLNIFVCMCMFRLTKPPQTLEELRETLKLLETLRGDFAEKEAHIDLIHDQFGVLDKYEVSVEQEVSISSLIKYTCV